MNMEFAQAQNMVGLAQPKSTMNDQLAGAIGNLTDVRRGLDDLEHRLFGEGQTDERDGPSPPMPDFMQWRVNTVSVGAADIAMRLKSILNRL